MSQSTKRKHVTDEVLYDFESLKDDQKIVKIVAGKGNNLHQVIEADEKTSYLVSMPTKFRKNVWIKRGDFCVIEEIEEGDKVKGEIVRILYKEQIRDLKKEKKWPFKDIIEEKSSEKTIDLPPSDEGSDSEDDSDLFQNPNRKTVEVSESSESESEDSD